jgi:hypothetical protein
MASLRPVVLSGHYLLPEGAMDGVGGTLCGQQGSAGLHINQCVVKYHLTCLIKITEYRAIGYNSTAPLL